MVVVTQDSASIKERQTPQISPLDKDSWQPLVQDNVTTSYAYYLPATSLSHVASWKNLDRWFQELQPSNYRPDESAWTEASYNGELLLRKTAWTVLDERCTCEYG